MTFTLIILTVTFVAAVWIAIDLLRPVVASRFLRSRPSAGAPSRGSGAGSYEPVTRLMGDADFDFLAEHADLAVRLRTARGEAMRLYLRQIRREFLDVWNVCRLLAPISPDPGFATRLSRQYWSFHFAYVSVYAQCMLPAMMPRTVAADRLVAALGGIRDQARELLAISDSALAAPSAA
jgi:hypothetical protein